MQRSYNRLGELPDKKILDFFKVIADNKNIDSLDVSHNQFNGKSLFIESISNVVGSLHNLNTLALNSNGLGKSNDNSFSLLLESLKSHGKICSLNFSENEFDKDSEFISSMGELVETKTNIKEVIFRKNGLGEIESVKA